MFYFPSPCFTEKNPFPITAKITQCMVITATHFYLFLAFEKESAARGGGGGVLGHTHGSYDETVSPRRQCRSNLYRDTERSSWSIRAFPFHYRQTQRTVFCISVSSDVDSEPLFGVKLTAKMQKWHLLGLGNRQMFLLSFFFSHVLREIKLWM